MMKQFLAAVQFLTICPLPASVKIGEPELGRSTLLVTMAVIPYARPEGGLAAIFYAHRSRYHLVWVMVALAVVGWLAGDWAGLTAGLASFVFDLLPRMRC